MDKRKYKSIKLITKLASNRGKNDKHPPNFTHNHKYSKKEIESILFLSLHDHMLFYNLLSNEKQIIFCNCVQHIIMNTDRNEIIERLSKFIENSTNNVLK